MLKNRRQQNNSGSALIIVIIAILFVGIIASIVLTITFNNLDAAWTNKQAAGAFYNAEQSVEELKASLQEYADEAVRIAYTQWLQEYSLAEYTDGGKTYTAEERYRKTFTDQFLRIMLEAGVLTAVSGDEYKLNYTFLDNFTDATPDSAAELAKEEVTIEITDEYDFKIKGVSVQYTDHIDDVALITTDLVFAADFPKFQANTVKGLNLKCAEYILIADGMVSDGEVVDETLENLEETSDGGQLGGAAPATIAGSVYGGAGISFIQNSNVNFYSRIIASRKALKLSYGSNVKIAGIRGITTTGKSNLWLRNIDLTTRTSTPEEKVTLDIYGDCRIADDTSLDANGCEFVLDAGSSYYGYNTNNVAAYRDAPDLPVRSTAKEYGTPSGSSAIIINAKDCVLDLTQATQVWIAGRAFVSVPTGFGAVGEDLGANFPEGEAITFRGEQAAYLVPGDCIVGIGHNPMTAAEWTKLKNGIDAGSDDYKIDINRSIRNGNINLSTYVEASDAFRAVTVNFYGNDTSKQMVYLYLNFISTTKAAAYFAEYYELNKELVEGRMTTFATTGSTSGKIAFNPITLYTTGNAIDYEAVLKEAEDEGDPELVYETQVALANISDSSVVLNTQIGLSSQFTGLITSLNPEYMGSESVRLTENVVQMQKVKDGGTGGKISYAYTYLDGAGEEAVEEREFDVPSYLSITTSSHPGYDLWEDYDQCYDYFEEGIVTSDAVSVAGGGAGNSKTANDFLLYISSGDVRLDGSAKGIIVCGGDVIIKNGSTFEGLIIAGGNIIVSGSAITNLTANQSIITYLIKNAPKLRPIFQLGDYDITSAGDGDEVYASDLIKVDYENWKKN